MNAKVNKVVTENATPVTPTQELPKGETETGLPEFLRRGEEASTESTDKAQ